MPDYVPAQDANFDNWQGTTLLPYISANKVALGVADATVTALTGGQTAWAAAYSAHQTAQAAATSKRQDKDDARAHTHHPASRHRGHLATPLAQD